MERKSVDIRSQIDDAWSRLLLISCFVFWLLTALGPAQERQDEEIARRIVFRIEGPGLPWDYRIAAFDVRDKIIRHLTERLPGFEAAFSLSVSPDGKIVAYLADPITPPEGGTVAFSVLVRSLDDLKANPQNLGVKAQGINGWSPDSKKLLITQLKDANGTAHIAVDIATKKSVPIDVPLFVGPKDATWVSGHYVSDWSPDGKWFVTSCGFGRASGDMEVRLNLVKIDGFEIRRLDHVPFGRMAKFAPDGKRILYSGRLDADDNRKHL